MKKKKRPTPIGAQLRTARLAAELTQVQLAAKTGVGQKYISDLECDRRRVTIDHLRVICKACRCGFTIDKRGVVTIGP